METSSKSFIQSGQSVGVVTKSQLCGSAANNRTTQLIIYVAKLLQVYGLKTGCLYYATVYIKNGKTFIVFKPLSRNIF